MARSVSLFLSSALIVVGLGAAAAQDADDGDGAGRLPGSRSEQNLGGAGYACTATNALKDQKCSISCRSRQEADCEDADGAGTPVCRCTN